MSSEIHRPVPADLIPPEKKAELEEGMRKGLEHLATEVEMFRLIEAQDGREQARIDTATHLIEGHAPAEILSLLLIAIDHLATEQDLAGVALARTVPAMAPDYGSGGYV